MTKWIKTDFPGVRYREHPTRKNGVKKDQYFTIRYKLAGKDKEEGLGWAKGGWSAAKAYARLAELKKNRKVGEGPQTLAEKREIERERRKQEQVEKNIQEKENVTFGEIFTKQYLPIQRQNKRKNACGTEQSLFKLWIGPIIDTLPLKSISPVHLEEIKKHMADAGRAPRTINYALSLIRQLYNFSKGIGSYSGDCPVSKVKIPRNDNRRQRFLTHVEAELILNALKEKSLDCHDMTLLSLHCGLRAGEVFSLAWADVNLEKGTLFLRDTKSGRNRHAYMTTAVKDMLTVRQQNRESDKVFIAITGGQVDRISKTFSRVVDELGLNAGINDPRHKIVFHSCRHTFASWLVESGVSLYIVQKLLGHENISQTARYSHLSQDTLQEAVRILENGIQAALESDNIVDAERA